MNSFRLFLGSLIVAFVAFILAIASAMGESTVDYTVVNQSSQSIYTWYQDEDCETEIRYKEHLGGETLVAAGETTHYSTMTQSTGCIRVTTADRLPLVVQKYTNDALITISDQVSPLSLKPVPVSSDLPHKPVGLTGHLRPITVVMLSIWLVASAACIIFGAWALFGRRQSGQQG